MDLIQQIGDEVQRGFRAGKRVLSFAEYLEVVQKSPTLHLRNVAQYLRDMFDHYGTETLQHPALGEVRRFSLFDAPWDNGRQRLVGQEEVQNAIYRVLNNFVRQRRVDRFILLHGPNGSSKSTVTEMLSRAMEDYSAQAAGALYRFNWVFPSQKVSRGAIGFGGSEEGGSGAAPADSYAHLDDAQVDARLPCHLGDHPLLLVPREARLKMMRELLAGAGEAGAEFILSEYLMRGDLCPSCRMIYDALLNSYEGDYLAVLRHIQVERFDVSRRYRAGSSRVEPQLAVDATLRQVTADRSLSALPTALQNINLFEVDGDLVQANRGVVDFPDLLKRPLEAYKYLLTTVEEGRVKLERANLFFDLLFVGSSNETHLQGLMQSPEWPSFHGRLELVRVPYLRQHRRERQIYAMQLDRRRLGKHLAPQSIAVAALWAVLSRLDRPRADHYSGELAGLVEKITPMEKAELYDRGRLPAWVKGEAVKVLRGGLDALWKERDGGDEWYEGYFGASPREVRTALMNAAQDPHYACVTPGAVLDALRALVSQASFYEYLRQKPQDGYRDHAAFVELVRTWYLDRADDTLRRASGLVEETGHLELFTRYVTHVMHALRGEKLENEITGAYEEPDRHLMERVEHELGVSEEDAVSFRGELISRIGAWSVDHSGARPDFGDIFPDQVDRLRSSYFDKQKRRIAGILGHVQAVLTEETESLDEADLEEAQGVVKRLFEDHGHCQACALEAVSWLLRERYGD